MLALSGQQAAVADVDTTRSELGGIGMQDDPADAQIAEVAGEQGSMQPRAAAAHEALDQQGVEVSRSDAHRRTAQTRRPVSVSIARTRSGASGYPRSLASFASASAVARSRG